MSFEANNLFCYSFILLSDCYLTDFFINVSHQLENKCTNDVIQKKIQMQMNNAFITCIVLKISSCLFNVTCILTHVILYVYVPNQTPVFSMAVSHFNGVTCVGFKNRVLFLKLIIIFSLEWEKISLSSKICSLQMAKFLKVVLDPVYLSKNDNH